MGGKQMKRLANWLRWGPSMEKFSPMDNKANALAWHKAMARWRLFNVIFYSALALLGAVGLIWWLSFVTVLFLAIGLALTFGFYANDESVAPGITANIAMPFMVLLGMYAVGEDVRNYNQGIIPYEFADQFALAGIIYLGIIAIELVIVVIAILIYIVNAIWHFLKWITGNVTKESKGAQ